MPGHAAALPSVQDLFLEGYMKKTLVYVTLHVAVFPRT